MSNLKRPIRFLALLAILSSAAAAQEEQPAQPAADLNLSEGCSADLKGKRPRIYIANFYVTYGKKDMGRLIGDYIAQRFEADGRFEVISREAIEDEMRPLFKNKLPADKYLQTTVDLAAAKNADCVIFGRISKAGSKRAAFLVRMASVQGGQNVVKIDTEVERKQALAFLESVGDSFVSYFQAAPEPVIAAPVNTGKEKQSGFFFNVIGGGGYLDLSGSVSGQSRGVGGAAGNFGVKLGVTIGGTISLFGAVDAFTAFDPTFRIGGSSGTLSGSGITAELSGNMFGAGLAIYTPSQFFISGTVGAAQSSISYTAGSLTISESTDTGFGANVNIGQEWSVNKHWGIGAALVGHYSQLPVAGNTWTQIYAGLAVTATYN